MKLHKRKITGIDPDDFHENDILSSIQSENDQNLKDDEEGIENEKPWTDMLIVSKKSSFYIVQNFVYGISCLISSYTYAWQAVYSNDDDFFKYSEIVFESYFFFTIILTFFVEYEVNAAHGGVLQIRDF